MTLLPLLNTSMWSTFSMESTDSIRNVVWRRPLLGYGEQGYSSGRLV